jgi:co-chaperonin GroES (HSP10)
MTTENKSGLKPLGRAVLCKPYEPELARTLLAIPETVRAAEMMKEMRGVVIAVGENCWPDEPARAHPGDKVLISKFSGVIVHGTADGELYRVCNDNDIFLAIEVGDLDKVLVKDPVAVAKTAGRQPVVTAQAVGVRK